MRDLHRALRIIVIDDERHIGVLLKVVLERAGFYAEYCVTAEDGRERLNSGGFDLAVVDLNLNDGANGLSLLKEVRKHSDIFWIMMSTDMFREELAAADGALSKPFNPLHLVEIARQIANWSTKGGTRPSFWAAPEAAADVDRDTGRDR